MKKNNLSLLLSLGTLTETVLGTTWKRLKVSHTVGTGGSSSLGLLGPVEGSNLGTWIAAGRTGLLLLVVADLTATTAASVSLGLALTETLSTLGLLGRKRKRLVRRKRGRKTKKEKEKEIYKKKKNMEIKGYNRLVC